MRKSHKDQFEKSSSTSISSSFVESKKKKKALPQNTLSKSLYRSTYLKRLRRLEQKSKSQFEIAPASSKCLRRSLFPKPSLEQPVVTPKVYDLKMMKSGPLHTLYALEESNVSENNNDVKTIDSKAKKPIERGQWSKSVEFLLSCISMSVGLGNVWRFPYVIYTNGGGAFLIPYLIVLFVIGRPLYYLDLILGQFSGKGPIKVWKILPAFKGIGYGQIVSTCYLAIFYNYLMGLIVYYLFASFHDPLPWTICDPSWATKCNVSMNTTTVGLTIPDQYFYNYVLRLSRGLDHITWFNWKLAICLVIAWTSVYLALIKGIRSLGKVAYFTSIFPYFVLFATLFGALTREGAMDGIIYFFKPQWEKLSDPLVWFNAVQQSFISLGVCFGSLLMYSSYNPFREDIYTDAIIVSVIDTGTSILSGCCVFSVLGSMAYQQGVEISNVVNKNGVGLAFIAYPQGLSQFDVLPNLWSILFFVMLFTLGLGSSVSVVETILTCLKDQYIILRKHSQWTALIVCSILCICGLSITTDGGLYVMKLLEDYGVGIAGLFFGILQTTGIMWIYGMKNFCDDVEFMLERRVGIFWRMTWSFVTPTMLFIIFTYGGYQMIATHGGSDPLRQGIPNWGVAIGWAMFMSSMTQIPFWLCVTIYRQSGTLKERIVKAFTSEKSWGPSDPSDHQEWRKFKLNKKHEMVVTEVDYQKNRAFEL